MGRGRAGRARRAWWDSSSARSAGGGGSRRRSLGSVFDRLEQLSGAWRVLHGPVGDDCRPALGDNSRKLPPRVGVARIGDVDARQIDPGVGEVLIDLERLLEVL